VNGVILFYLMKP